jgi:hypothetical protein
VLVGSKSNAVVNTHLHRLSSLIDCISRKRTKNDIMMIIAHLDDVLHSIQEFVGTGKFRFLAGVNRQFQHSYRRLCKGGKKKDKGSNNGDYYSLHTKTSMRAIVESVSRCQLYLKEVVCPSHHGNYKMILNKRLNRIARFAARDGKLDVLRFAIDNGCKPDASIMANAARGGRLEILEHFAHEHGLPWWASCACAWAAQEGHLEVLIWTHNRGLPWDATTCEQAASAGCLQILQWVRPHGCPWSTWTCSLAARLRTLEDPTMGKAERMPLGCQDVCRSRCRGAYRHPSMGMGQRVSLGCKDVANGSGTWAF